MEGFHVNVHKILRNHNKTNVNVQKCLYMIFLHKIVFVIKLILIVLLSILIKILVKCVPRDAFVIILDVALANYHHLELLKLIAKEGKLAIVDRI